MSARTEALQAVRESIEKGGQAELVQRQVKRLVQPPANKPAEWLTPKEAAATYSQVWIVRTASGAEVQARLSSHRRGGGKRKQWFAVNLATGREVRVTKLKKGSKR